MAGFLYYTPGRKDKLNLDDLRGLGLGYAFDNAPSCCGVQGGPDKSNGLVVADSKRIPDHLIRYHADRQTWRRMPGSEAWAGFYTDDPPLPRDLLRPAALRGHPVELGDGNTWIVPIARAIREDNDMPVPVMAVPTVSGLDDDGNWTQGDVAARYRPLWDVACQWWDIKAQAAGQDAPVTFAESHDAALVALATNYYVGKVEIVLRGLFSWHAVTRILDATVDWPTIQDFMEKKTLADGSCVMPGSED